jgi:hypothetical protein
MSSRKQRRDAALWESATRTWATESGRSLAVDLYHNNDLGIRPYTVGVVLTAGEKVWAQFPARCSEDTATPVRPGPPRKGDPPPQAPVTDWLVTSQRVAGRLFGNVLRWWSWTDIVGARVDLTLGREWVQLDPSGKPPVIWTGPGVGPLAVAAVYHLHGARAMIDHPGLAPLRAGRPVPAPPAPLHRRELETSACRAGVDL